jgi:hypothetical protein
MSHPFICFLSGALGAFLMFATIAFLPEIGEFLERFKK